MAVRNEKKIAKDPVFGEQVLHKRESTSIMKSRKRCLTFILLAAVLLLSPLLLGRMDDALALSGVSITTELQPPDVDSLLNGDFQEALGEYVEQNLPGKPFLVRLRNQILFSVFRTVPNNNYSMNSRRNLFTWGNVGAYLQYDEPVTRDDASELTDRLTRFKKLLADNGRQMYLFITPCKVRYYEDELPWADRVLAPERGEGNYERFVAQLEESGLDYFDSIEYLNTHSFDPRVPLFYDTNVHWSVYVGNCVGAAFGRWLEEKSGYDLPEITIDAVPCDVPVYPDSDAVRVLNLLEKPYGEYYEPVITTVDARTDAPGALFRGGSFMGQSISMLISSGYFGKDVYMENAQLFTDRFGHVVPFHDYAEIDMKTLFEGIDMVILEVNEPSIPDLSFGFIDYILENPQAAGLKP